MTGFYFYGLPEAQIFTGGVDFDTVDYSASAAVKIDLLHHTALGGNAAGDQFISIDLIIGSDSATERDWLWGDDNANIFWGMAGKDILEGGGGADFLDGGAGWDYARYTRSNEAVHVNLATNVNTGGHAEGDQLFNIEAVVGSAYDDTLTGGTGNDYLSGEAGDDTLAGAEGADTLLGKDGNDTYIYLAGKDVFEETTGIDRVEFDAIWSPDVVTLTGNVLTLSPDDQITFNDISLIEFFSFSGFADMTLTQLQDYIASGTITETGTPGSDDFTGSAVKQIFQGGGSSDTVDYSAGPAVTVDLQNGTASGGLAAGDILNDIENIFGSNSASAAERDFLYGDADVNALYGMAGKDILEGGDGADFLDGGAGWDYARYIRSDAAVNINLTTNVNTGGHADGDILVDIEAVVGSKYNDKLFGSSAYDYLKGEKGNDVIFGGGGNDELYGGEGFDTALYSGAFEDYVIFGSGSSLTVQGPEGNDLLADFERLIFQDGSYEGGVFTSHAHLTGKIDVSGITDITTVGGIQNGDMMRIITTNDLGAQLVKNITIQVGDSASELVGKINTAFSGGEVYARLTANGYLQILGADARSFKVTDAAGATALTLAGYQALGLGDAFRDETRGATTLAASTTVAGHTVSSIALYEANGTSAEAGDLLSGTYKDSAGNTIWSGFGAGSQITFNFTNNGVNDSTGGFTVTASSTFQDLMDHINLRPYIKPFLSAEFENGILSITALQDSLTKLEIVHFTMGASVFDIGLGDPTGTLDPVTGAGFQNNETVIHFSNAQDLNYFAYPEAAADPVSTNHMTGKIDVSSISDLTTLSGIANNDVIRFITTNDSGVRIFRDITVVSGDSPVSLAAKITNAFADFYNGELSAHVTESGFLEIQSIDGRSFKVTAASMATDIGLNGYNSLGLGDYFASETRGGTTLISSHMVAGDKLASISLYEGVGNYVDFNDIFVGGNYKDAAGNTVLSGFAVSDSFTIEINNADTTVSTATLNLTASTTFQNFVDFINTSSVLQTKISADFDDFGVFSITKLTDAVNSLEFKIVAAGFTTFDIGLGDPTGNMDPIIGTPASSYGPVFSFSDVPVTTAFTTPTAFTEIKEIHGFDAVQGDKLDLADILDGYDPLSDAIADFIKITDNGTDSAVFVDANGGADSFVQVATLYGATSLTNEELLEIKGTLVTI